MHQAAFTQHASVAETGSTAVTSPAAACPFETEVLIIGAGPVGLAVAVELGLRGIACEVIDQVDAIGHWWTRAMNMNKRTMEHMRRWGLADTLKAINYVPKDWPGYVTIVDRLGGRQLSGVVAQGLAGYDLLPDAAENPLWIAQGQVQEVLLDKVRALGIAVHFSQRATGLCQFHDAGVEVAIETQKWPRTVRARYVVGCDGGRSVVRQTAGIEYEGAGALSRQISVFFRAPGLLADLRRRGVADAVMYFCADPLVPGTARLIAGDRWEFTYRPAAGFDESQLDAESVVRALVGPDVEFELERSYPFSYVERRARQVRVGSVFLAGDAVHMIPPLGGHNLNLGFGDAVNLGWKLAHVLKGWADASILDSYGPERLPMVKRTASEALRNYQRLVTTFSRLAELMAMDGDTAADRARRDATSRAIANDLGPQWRSDGTVLDQRYAQGALVLPEQDEAPAYDSEQYQVHAAPGHRAPMWRDAEGRPLYDRFGPEYTLLCLSAAAADRAQVLAQALSQHHLPVRQVHLPVTQLRELYGADLVLVRPDQHVAWRGNEAAEQADAIAEVLTGRAVRRKGALPQPVAT